jgi:hypothetical protein
MLLPIDRTGRSEEGKEQTMFRILRLIATALVAAAIMAPLASANSKPVDPLAVSVLKGRGWTAGQIYDWTQGACSYEVKPASCYLTPAEAKLASQSLAYSMHHAFLALATPTAVTDSRGGFNWGDGLIGSGVTIGIVLVGAAGAFALYRRREPAHT